MIERYSRPEMAHLWTLENKFRVWLEVELAVCQAWFEQGVIPEEDWRAIQDKADFDLDRVLQIEERTKHDVIAFLTAVEEKVGPSARFIHLGCTSSDIGDTANGVLLTRAGKMVDRSLDRLLLALKHLAMEHKYLPCMGRTHGIHAEPTTFGLKMASFYAEFTRARQRLTEAREAVRVGKISGAVGTYAHLNPEVEARALEILGLAPDPVSTQIIQRDRYAHFFSSLALMAGGVERLGVELRHLQRTEVREVEEGFSKGQKGSSAMPHKKNPISAENLCGLSRLIRTNALAAMENMPLWHERDISHSSVERVIMPDSTILADYTLSRMAGVLENLRVLPGNMAANMERSFGLHYSQRLLYALIETGLPRQKAYEMIQRVALSCWENGRSFPEEARADEEIASHLDSKVFQETFDPSWYMRYVDTIFTRVFGA